MTEYNMLCGQLTVTSVKMRLLSVTILCLTLGFAVDGAKILAVLHVPTRSHHIIGEHLMYALAAKGHEVTIVSAFMAKEKTKNVREIYLKEVKEVAEAARKGWIDMSSGNEIKMIFALGQFVFDLANATLTSTEMQKLMKSGEKFDVVMIEPFGNDAFFGLGHLFNAHVVVLSTAISNWVNPLAGNVAPYSFVPSIMTMYNDKMTFLQRCYNTFSSLLFKFYNDILVYPEQKQLYEEFFKGAPPFNEAIKNASLHLINSNIIFETPRPYLPSMIPIGGLQIQEPKKLPQDLQTYLDNAKEGVILFSLGSNLHSMDLPLEKREAILKSFAKLPQKVLWKFEDEDLPGKPKNVKIGKWLPQSDILAHPNVKLFITHGGLLSSTEAVHRGVPILGIPFYGDQFGNIEKFVSAGYGQRILFNDITEETFTAILKEVLNNPRYQENVKRASAIVTDQLEKPIDRAIFWVEHIIRSNGGKHLRCSSLDLNLAQYLLLDVIGAVVLVSGTLLYVVYFILKKMCCSQKSRKDAINKAKKVK